MKLLYHEAKLASLSYILVLSYIYATLQPTRLLTYLLKRLLLHFLHSMNSQDVTRWILLVTWVPSPQGVGAGHLWEESGDSPAHHCQKLQSWAWNSSSTLVRRAVPRRVTIMKGSLKLFFFDYKHSSAWSIKSLGHRDITCYSSSSVS